MSSVVGEGLAVALSAAAAVISAGGAVWSGREAKRANKHAEIANGLVLQQQRAEVERLETERKAGRIRWSEGRRLPAGHWVIRNLGTHEAVNVQLMWGGDGVTQQLAQDEPFEDPGAGGRLVRSSLGGWNMAEFPSVPAGGAMSFRLINVPDQAPLTLLVTWAAAADPAYVGAPGTDPDLAGSEGRQHVVLVPRMEHWE